jgi:hypothetical protein
MRDKSKFWIILDTYCNFGLICTKLIDFSGDWDEERSRKGKGRAEEERKGRRGRGKGRRDGVMKKEEKGR